MIFLWQDFHFVQSGKYYFLCNIFCALSLQPCLCLALCWDYLYISGSQVTMKKKPESDKQDELDYIPKDHCFVTFVPFDLRIYIEPWTKILHSKILQYILLVGVLIPKKLYSVLKALPLMTDTLQLWNKYVENIFLQLRSSCIFDINPQRHCK